VPLESWPGVCGSRGRILPPKRSRADRSNLDDLLACGDGRRRTFDRRETQYEDTRSDLILADLHLTFVQAVVAACEDVAPEVLGKRPVAENESSFTLPDKTVAETYRNVKHVAGIIHFAARRALDAFNLHKAREGFAPAPACPAEGGRVRVREV